MKLPGRYQGGSRLLSASLTLGVLGLLLTGLSFIANPQQALFSYLVGFAYWFSLAIGSLFLLSIFHAANAKWPVLLRRMLEIMAFTVIVFAPLFLPIAAGMKHLFVWVSPPANLPEQTLELLKHKQPYLNVPFFLARTAVYFVVWIAVSALLNAWSARQDEVEDLGLTTRQRRLGASSLPFLAITLTFAAFDWLMSLHPTWYSTIFGVYYFAGGFLGAIAAWVVITVRARGPNLYGALASPDHYQSMGNFLFAFTVFWAYIGFSQFMLIWMADLPEEVRWYLLRATGRWEAVAVALFFGHFLLPFFALLSRALKRTPRPLGLVAAWLLFFHYLDVYWIIMPALHPQAPHPHWADLTAWVGIGGIAVAFGIWRIRGRYTVPVGDPYLQISLQYRQP